MTARDLFTPAQLDTLFPLQRTDAFFDALYGDAEEGAYDIRLVFDDDNPTDALQQGALRFYFALHQRPGKCLACNVTYGLPQVFVRHPIINLKGLVDDLSVLAGWQPETVAWTLGETKSVTKELYRISLELNKK